MKKAKITKIDTYKSDERGVIYDCGKVRIISRKQGSTSANHQHEEKEVLFLISGKIELEVGEERDIISGYKKIEIPGNIHHTVKALTDIILLIDREIR